MKLPTIIQGGMGVAISNWKLARAVSMQGQLGVVSGTEIAQIMISRLMDGDIGGHIRTALNHFPFQYPVQRILKEYFVKKPSTPKPPYKRPSMWTLKPTRALNELTVISNFVEVYLAKLGHAGPVGINLLEKVQLPTMASIYGAMLAGIDYVIMGAGIPVQVPGILDKLTQHEPVQYRVDVQGAAAEDRFSIHFNPQAIFPDITAKLSDLLRPMFLPVVSSAGLAKVLLKKATGKIDGLIVEAHKAGGHNAPPRGATTLNDQGEPVYGSRDEIDLSRFSKFGIPFWLAGGYDSPEQLSRARDVGAAGVQVGTPFSYCDESGMEPSLKERVISKVLGRDIQVRTSAWASPTGFPFKVAGVEGTLSEETTCSRRTRVCDLGLLRQLYKRDDGVIGYRCPAEPIDQYIAKGGRVEETVGRCCLCNNLSATAGYPQHRKDGYVEPPIITAGDDLPLIGKYIKEGRRSFAARDVIDFLLRKSATGGA